MCQRVAGNGVEGVIDVPELLASSRELTGREDFMIRISTPEFGKGKLANTRLKDVSAMNRSTQNLSRRPSELSTEG